MDPKLVQAIAERVKAGVSENDIKHEVMGSGYDEVTFNSAYTSALAVATDNLSGAPREQLRSEDLLEISRLFRESWQMCRSNISLLAKTILTIGISLAGLGAISFYIYHTFTAPEDGMIFYIGGTMLLVLAFMIIIVTAFATIVRALLHRTSDEVFSEHLKWAFLHIIGITLVSCYISILTQIGYLFFFIPGVVLTVFLIFSTFYVIEGSYKGVASLVASTELVYGRFFVVFGRVLLSMVVYMAVMMSALLLTSILVFLNPFLMALVIVLMFAIMFVGFFWQLCFTITLFEALKSTPVNEAKPISTRALYLTYKTVVVLVLGVLMIGAFFLGFFATSFDGFDAIRNDLIEMETTSDVAHKQTIRSAALDADFYNMEKGTYEDVCSYLTLSTETECESTATAFALETPLSWGFYCVDSTGYNEVHAWPVLKNSSCNESDPI